MRFWVMLWGMGGWGPRVQVVPGWGMGGLTCDRVWFGLLRFGFTGMRGSKNEFWKGREGLVGRWWICERRLV